MRRPLSLLALTVAVLAAAPARADRRYILIPGSGSGLPPPRDVPSRLLLDAGLGPAYIRAGARMNGITQSVSGIGPELTAAVGYVTTPDLLLGIEYAGIYVFRPWLDTKARSNNGSGLTFASHTMGPTIRYYFGPDLFFSATPVVTRLKLSDNDMNGFEWKWGYGLRAGVGSVWRLDTRWILSVGAQVQFSRNASAAPAAPTWTTLAGGLLVNLSFR